MTEHKCADEGQVLGLFPTPVYTTKLEGDSYGNVQSELQTVVDKLYANDTWGQNKQWNSSEHFLSNAGNFEQNLLEQENMQAVVSMIFHHCLHYMSATNTKPGYKPAIVSSWLTLTKPGLHAHIHDHGTNQISGVYWFKTNGNDGNIYFRNALKALKCNPVGATIAHEAEFSPEQGRLVMWPSFMDHGVYENKTEDDRISLSFNITLERGEH
jgi:uncharacterized protein (TIGR02466 family)